MKIRNGHMPVKKEEILWLEEIEGVLTERAR